MSVADLEVTARRYCEKLGFVEDFRYAVPEMGMQAVFLALGDFRLEIVQLDESRPADPDELELSRYLGIRGLKHVALAVDDLDAARTVLEERGVRFVNDAMTVPNSGGHRFCFFTDPDGVLIELYQTSARANG